MLLRLQARIDARTCAPLAAVPPRGAPVLDAPVSGIHPA
ncbi:hypothetical protein QF050_001726 [Arthrobacter sp. SLBN-112]|nr:hypothetical protein [Arthrobacter sp. SLBN-112]